ncbi:hypothetical protein [Streptomyces sp. NBC_00582]|uniref:hypothetical protein n=1 Tax=Streptomyces sp. NBC_00582 TaxID=2975783 RepID=UPI002E80447E|nr:hypothetical protein [Streptomyces sp. NBC_00582]WUB68295.1 hypothetical protein OG852_49155 [Streptomyces sp. NBC_00582]WUB68605.1 hypothetical protein OG852_50805 [Streptomyces sp. NBC_00582]
MTRQADSDAWRALLHETYAVEQLGNDLTRQALRDGAVDGPSQRRYLLRRAALADRADPLQRETGFAAAGEVDADLAALGLLEWDRGHGTGRGPVAAADGRWDADPRGYLHQEHAVLVLDEDQGEPGA